MEEQPSVISPSVPWPPVLGKGPLHCQHTEAYPDARAQRLPSLIGTPSRPLGLEGAPAWPSPGSHGARGPFRQERKPPVPQVDGNPRRTLAVSARITWRPLPVPIGTPSPFQDCLLLECWRPPGPVPHFLPSGAGREGSAGDWRAQVHRPAWAMRSGGRPRAPALPGPPTLGGAPVQSARHRAWPGTCSPSARL